MEKAIQINNKSELITTLLNLERDLNCITKLYINVDSVGLAENKDMLFKVLSKADGLCKVYYEHRNILYEYTNLQRICDIVRSTKDAISDTTNTVDAYKAYYTTLSDAYIGVNNIMQDTIHDESYYISPITDITRFDKILKGCITVLNSKEDFKIIDCVFPTTNLIHVLRPKQKGAIDTIYSIYNDKLHQHIGLYIFIFKCGKDWYTLSRERYVHISYKTNLVLDVSGTDYKIVKGGK